VDVNWRPVFFDDEAKAKKTITPYVLEADLLKVRLLCRCIGSFRAWKRALAAVVPSCALSVAQVTEDEAEWLFGIPGDVALSMPERVWPPARRPMSTCQAKCRPLLASSWTQEDTTSVPLLSADAAGAGVPAEGQGRAGDGGRRGQLLRLQGRQRQGRPAGAGARAEGGAAFCPDVHAAVCMHAATSACRPGRQWQRPIGSCVAILQVDVMDTTGAGDGFLGGFLHHTVKKGAPPRSASACPLWGLQQTVCRTHCCCSAVVT
jgi:hypothetical protein